MPERKRVVTIATNAELLSQPYWRRLQMTVVNCRIDDRVWPTRIQNMLLFVDGEGIELRCSCGVEYPIPYVDDAWVAERYVRRFLTYDYCRYPSRDRLLDLFFRIHHPRLAAHFGR